MLLTAKTTLYITSEETTSEMSFLVISFPVGHACVAFPSRLRQRRFWPFPRFLDLGRNPPANGLTHDRAAFSRKR